MICKLCAVLAAVAMIAVVASPVEAGGSGGGTKKSVTMKVRNAQAATEAGVPVIYLPTGATPPAANASAFFAAGGKVVNPGQTVNFLVAPGTGTAATVRPDYTPGGTAAYTAANGKIGRAVVEGTAAAPTIRGE